MRYLIKYSFLLLLFIGKPVATCSQQAYSLTLDELFRLGTENSLRLQASHMQEVVAADKKKTAQTVAAPALKPGDQVDHKAFGHGMITSCKPMGGDILLEITFDKVGTKRLMAKSAMNFMTKK